MPLLVPELQEGTGSISGDVVGMFLSHIMARLKACLKTKPSAPQGRVGISVVAELSVVILIPPSLPRPCLLPRDPDLASPSTSLCHPVWEASTVPKGRKHMPHGQWGKDVENSADKMGVKTNFILTGRTKGGPGRKTETLLRTELT